MTMKQAQAVVLFTKKVLGDRFQEGMDVKSYATDADHEAVTELVTASIENGETAFSDEAKAKYDTTKKIMGYVRGMVTNWWNKHKDLNGGVKHEYKNPGSRQGVGDTQLRELRKLFKQLEAKGSPKADLDRVQAAIAERVSTIAATKAAKIEVNADALPEGLRDLLAS